MKTPTSAEDFSGWIGRSEVKTDVLESTRVIALEAALGRTNGFQIGDPLPPLRHWLYFWDPVPPAELGTDGHPRVGSFMPPSSLPRRMWAGGRLQLISPLHLGDAVERRSIIMKIEAKGGRSGNLLFVTVQHELTGPGGLAIIEEQDIVYRDIVASGSSADAPTDTVPAAWRKTTVVDPVLLFRYSALTMNGHRIHYDAAYARAVELYPELVVQGPLQATLLADLAQDRVGAPLRRFAFRGRGPAFSGRPLNLSGDPKGQGGTLWTDQGGSQLMTADFSCQRYEEMVP